MSRLKNYNKTVNVLQAAKQRISETFDNFEKIYVSFSGGKDSTAMLHLTIEEAKRRNRKVGILVIDLEAQYKKTIEHVQDMLTEYYDYAECYWVCLPLALRNAVSHFDPKWTCWDPQAKDIWVREIPDLECVITTDNCPFDFFVPGMEFEEFMVLFGEWYSGYGKHTTAGLVGIRTDESLNRFRTISSESKETFNDLRYTTKVSENLYNVYPIYDWNTSDIWKYMGGSGYKYNEIYDYMYKAGMGIHEMRLCQPYGDDQKRGLWLYHILEADTWYKVVGRVNGVNSGALYIQESGNITGYRKITKPEHHTWESFCKLLLATLPAKTKLHYQEKFTKFLTWWKDRGYATGIPDEAPKLLEEKGLAPSWRRLCKVILRNDYWCKSLKFTQPKSQAYGKYLEMKKLAKIKGVSISDLDRADKKENQWLLS